MVSTRGGTRTTGAEDKKQSTLQKKPVRKTNAKAAPAAQKAKTTRSKKAEAEPAQLDEDEEDEIRVAEPQPETARRAQSAKPEPAKQAATRPKKDEVLQKGTTAKSATKTTKSTASASTAKPKVTKSEKPDLAPPAPVPAKGTRATRATRATAAKERVPPLSPKKITQVSKAPAKGARAAPKAKASAAPSRPTTRKRRNVSDENADVTATSEANGEPEDESVAVQQQRHGSRSKAGNGRTAKPSLVEDETPASSRPTTPSDGIGLSLEGTDDEVAEASEVEQDEGDDFEEGDYTNNTSQDELCGPKTPMKRSSPRFGTHEASRALDLGLSSKTPARHFAVLGTQQGTPQTTRPYRQPDVPYAEIGPTTVSRARDRAMVFPKLQPLTLGAEDSEDEQLDALEDESMPPRVHADVDDVASDASAQDLTTSTDVDAMPEPDTEACPDAALDQLREADDDVMMGQEDAKQMIDSEEAIVVPDDELESSPASLVETSFNSNESVIVTRPAMTLEETPVLEEAMQIDEMPTTTPKPETLVWENIRQDVTIPFNFEVDMSRGLPEVEHNDRLSMANALAQTFQEVRDAVAGAEQDRDTPEVTSSQGHDDVEAPSPADAAGMGRESLDATVNLSDFIDVKSLSESRRLSNAASAYAYQETPKNTSEEDIDQASTSTSLSVLAQEKAASKNEVFEDETPEDTSLESGDATTFSHAPLSPARDVYELDIALNNLQQQVASNTPRYAMPTISSRRKSLPAKLYPGTLLKEGVRPNTSDGAGIPSLATPSRASWRTQAPVHSRPATAHGLRSMGKTTNRAQTPRVSKTPLAKTPGTSVPLAWQSAAKNGTPLAKSPISRTLFAKTPATSVPEFRSLSAKERFPGLPCRSTYEIENVIQSAAAAPATAYASPTERFPAMPSRSNYEDAIKTPRGAYTPAATAVSAVKSAAKERFPGLPSKKTYEELSDTPEQQASEQPSTPEPASDRYSGLPHRRRYEEYAKTAMPTSRFRTPSQSPAKRPATVKRQASLRKVALKASTPAGSRTPIKTPLKAPAFTPGQVPMTPHPSVPLRGVVALVEVYTSDGDCATPAFAALLQRLGAKTTKTFSERLTHVVYKDGSPNTLQRIRIHNKQDEESGTGKEIHCVNSRWVTDCDAQGMRMPEADEAYAVEVDDVPRTAKRRRKSMEPMSLTNVKGSVFRNRQSSLGRSSLGRTPMSMDSADEEKTTLVNVEDKENSDDGSPATPAYLAAPNSLIQQTAPLNKIRKLDFKSKEAAKNRRLTFWNGGK